MEEKNLNLSIFILFLTSRSEPPRRSTARGSTCTIFPSFSISVSTFGKTSSGSPDTRITIIFSLPRSLAKYSISSVHHGDSLYRSETIAISHSDSSSDSRIIAERSLDACSSSESRNTRPTRFLPHFTAIFEGIRYLSISF